MSNEPLRIIGGTLMGSAVILALLYGAGLPARAQSDVAATSGTGISSLPDEFESSSTGNTNSISESLRTVEVPAPEDEVFQAEGKALFRGLCSGCHGGAGRGGKGPDLTDERWIHGSTDTDIARVIHNGVPKTTMKKLGESLKPEQISKIIAYVRSLARAPGSSTWKPYILGDSHRGQQLFFDEEGVAACGKCHSANGKGGRIGPAMDRIASRRSAQYIMESILQPSKDIDPRYEAVQVVTEDGRVIKGLRVNETNFTLQVREENGRFHSLAKRDLDEFQVLKQSLMPENQAERMTVKQLHDLFSFLMTLE